MKTFLFKVDDPVRGFNMTTTFAKDQADAEAQVRERFETDCFKFIREVSPYGDRWRQALGGSKE